MTDMFSPEKRSEIMSKIRQKNTKPEVFVRRILFGLGYRFRIHDKKLPGMPDIVLTKFKTVIFVHGCFWHLHEGCKDASIPKTNVAFWNNKLAGNVERDKVIVEKLNTLGWKTIIIWECEIKNTDVLKQRLMHIRTF